jgi:hypothetical protein
VTLALDPACRPPPGQLPAQQPIYVYRGDSRAWRWRLWADPERTIPYDLAGAELAAQIRRMPDARFAVDLDLAVDLPNVVIMHLSAEGSRQVPNGRWDLQATWPDGRVQTLIFGRVSVTLDVTRD